ncbi:tyrosine-type recombinase/integrase [Lacticaseibacillus sharpeae]|nr:site-specific integrase [Lacticaseibacillus sharpeae]
MAAARFMIDVENGELDKPKQKKYTFAEVYVEWLDNYKNTVRESTWSKTVGFFDIHILPAFGRKYIDRITTRDVQRAVKQWAAETTQNYKRWFIFTKQLFEYGMQQGYCESNPAKLVTLPRHQDKAGTDKLKSWTPVQMRRFFDCIDQDADPETYAMFYTLAASGMRRGELLALTWSDVSFSDSSITVNKTLAAGVKGRLMLDAPKTRTSRRTIPMDTGAMQVLRRWHLIQAQWLLALGVRGDARKQLVFSNRKNGLHSLDTPHKRLRALCDANGLEYISVHGFRHSAISNMLAAGVDVATVQKRMGHASPEITLKVYAHVSKEQAKEGAEIGARYLGLS